MQFLVVKALKITSSLQKSINSRIKLDFGLILLHIKTNFGISNTFHYPKISHNHSILFLKSKKNQKFQKCPNFILRTHKFNTICFISIQTPFSLTFSTSKPYPRKLKQTNQTTPQFST